MSRLHIFVVTILAVLVLSGCDSKMEIVFETNGGSSVDRLYVEPDYFLDQNISTEKQGYTFDGWYFDPVFALQCDSEARINVDTTLYAKWNINRYTITLDISRYDDSEDVYSLERLYKTSGPIQEIELEGFNFIGWYIDDEFDVEYEDDTKTIEDYTLYGKYEDK